MKKLSPVVTLGIKGFDIGSFVGTSFEATHWMKGGYFFSFPFPDLPLAFLLPPLRLDRLVLCLDFDIKFLL